MGSLTDDVFFSEKAPATEVAFLFARSTIAPPGAFTRITKLLTRYQVRYNTAILVCTVPDTWCMHCVDLYE